MRLIDADVIRAKHISIARYFKAFENGKKFSKLIGVLVKRIDEAPTLDYAPVRHGEFVNLGFLTCKCSLCETTFHDLPAENFCPNCGAKMDGGEKDG